MVEPQKSKVNTFASSVATDEATLAARVQSLTCLLHLGQVIQSEDCIEKVGRAVPDILAEGLSPAGRRGVRLVLGGLVSHSSRFDHSPHVFRKRILSRQSPIGEIEIHVGEASALAPEQEDLVGAVAERLGRFYERKDLQSALERSEERYRRLFQQARDGIVLADAESGTIIDANESFLDMVGLSLDEARSRKVWEMVGTKQRDQFRADLERGAAEQERQWLSLPIVAGDKGTLELEVSCSALHSTEDHMFQFICRDTTEVREAQRAMIQSDKMAAIGEMTSGFAHEIGTPLGIISANAQYLLQQWGGREGTEELRAILSETNRITNLIQQLLIFSRPARFCLLPTSVNDLVGDVLSLMQSQEIMRAVEVESEFSPEIPLLPLEPTLIKQVFLNLVINACQAMPDGGRLTVTSRVGRLQPGKLSGAPHVEVAFSDTGVGISETNLRKVFTPFFTTKEVGKGTGLGLSVSYRIVQNHGGTIVAESRGENQGATFRVYLPVADPPEATGNSDNESASPAEPWGGCENGNREENRSGRG